LTLILGRAAVYGLVEPPTRRGVTLPRVAEPVMRVPTAEQVEEFAAAIDARLWAMVRLAGYAGLRQGECLALEPASIDWLRRRVWVGRTLNKRTRQRESTKSGRGRWVTLPTIVVESLSEHVKEYPCDEWVFHRQGSPWPAAKLWATWDDARTACGLPDVRFHDLRHAAASLMIAAGWSAKRVQVELGHHDPAFTLRVYGHLFPDEIDSGRAQLDALLARKSGLHTDHAASGHAERPLV
jgi:integrase